MSTTLLVSSVGNAWQNLAVEDYMLDRTEPDDAVIYFFINSNAVIIGRNQNPWAECRLRQMETDGVQLARRISGGGAVYHDRGNLNFSFIMGSNRYNLQKQTELILSTVRAMGIPCNFSGRNDLLADGRKFSGNAFCERSKAKMHHGTLLVNTDMEKLQHYLSVDIAKLTSKGIHSVRSRVCNLREFRPDLNTDTVLEKLKEVCRSKYGDIAELNVDNIKTEELEQYITKHSSTEWRFGKTPQFDYEAACRFPWGGVQLHLRLRSGAVESLDVYSDANDVTLAERIRNRLPGVSFDSAALSHALRKENDSCLDDLADYLMKLNL